MRPCTLTGPHTVPDSKSTDNEQSEYVRNLPDVSDRYAESHLFPPPFRHSPMRDQVRVVIRRDIHLASLCVCVDWVIAEASSPVV
jgi:hypothetical protein